MRRLLIVFAVALVYTACQPIEPSYDPKPLQAMLAAEYAQLDQRHDDFFLSAKAKQLQRRKIQFSPLLADTITFDTATWRQALWEQYQIKSTQPIQYINTSIQGSYEEKMHILNLLPEPQDRDHNFRQFVWNAKGFLIYESEAASFGLIAMDSLDSLPYVLIVQPDTRPSHHLLAYSNSSQTLVDKMDNYTDNLPPTASQPELGVQYLPAILSLRLADLDGDGLTDLSFEGTRLLANNKKEPVSFRFLYRRAKDAFMWSPE